MDEVDIYIRRALEANPIRESVLRQVIQSLNLPLRSRGLDAGCGIGLQALLLAESVGPDGHITGLDIMPGLLAYGREIASKASFRDQVDFCAGDISSLPFDDHVFDWVWSADCIGYPLGELAPLLTELLRVLKPGGKVVLLGWSSQQVLPGYPLLEARLNTSCSSYVPFFEGKDPELNFLRAKRWFQSAGLQDIQAKTFVEDVQAPLRINERTALTSLFEMLWGQRLPGTAPEDWKEYQRLCVPGSADFILDSPDYYAFFTYTLFQGKAPRK